MKKTPKTPVKKPPAKKIAAKKTPAKKIAVKKTAGAKNKKLVLFEVFIRSKRGLSHIHAGGVYAQNANHALLLARDCYVRRAEGVSVWVCPSTHIEANHFSESDSFYDPMAEKEYRHASHYQIPEEVKNL